MPDLNNKSKTKTIIMRMHREYKDSDISFGERPDIHIKKYGVGIEVTRAFSSQEGIFYANARKEIWNPNQLLLNILTTGNAYIIENTEAIICRISKSIHRKAKKIKGYKAENPWIKYLRLAVIIGYDLELYDLDLAISNLEYKDKVAFDGIYLIMPSYSFYFDGRVYVRVEE